MKQIFGKAVVTLAGAMIIFSGCDSTKRMSKKDKGVVIGTTGGAVIGGVIGNNVGNKKNTALGAIIGAVVGGVAGGLIGNKMDKQAEAIKSEIPGAEVTRVGEGINVTFNEKNPDGSKAGVYFATEMYNINSNSKLALDKLVKVFNAYPETNILIEGHTDNAGTETYNETLSKRRADAVGNYLKSASITGSRLTINHYGETQPKVDNSTDAGKAENRRVEFAITANDKMKEAAAKEAANQ
ncbi:MAG: OmpA family protein [Ferruginibacter sp.]|nr:OmpA family protein [Ferruginibacter sp.]